MMIRMVIIKEKNRSFEHVRQIKNSYQRSGESNNNENMKNVSV